MVSKNPASKRDYKKEARYEDTPQQVAHREERNKARAQETRKAGHALSGDVAHIKPLAREGGSGASNLRVETVAKNRSWRAGQKGYHVPDDK